MKIRSDEEIDNYDEKQFLGEKDAMSQVDGFTLVDYIKSSVEILMNMKGEDEDGEDEQDDDVHLMVTPGRTQ